MSCYKVQNLQAGATATGNGTPMPVTEIDNEPVATTVVQVTGIATATITWEGTVDGTNWAGLMATALATGTAAATATANGLYRLDVRGLLQVRARISAYTAGTITALALGIDR